MKRCSNPTAGSVFAGGLEPLEPRQLLSGSRHKPFPPPPLSSINDWVYQLQNVNLKAIAATHFDLAVIDYSEDGTDATAFGKKSINALEQSGPHGKNVLAYMSIGEAENYRYYWNNAWDPTNSGTPSAAAPSWLGPVDPDWPGNYTVKYWDPAWQKIIFSYIDKVIGNGFDGVYLDVIDDYQYWAPGGASGLNRASAEADMVHFVESIASYARAEKPGFEIFVQNAEEIGGDYPDYVAAVDGIGEEDTWTNGNSPNDDPDINYTTDSLNVFKDAGKLVLCIDYPSKRRLIDAFYAKAQAKGYVPYASDRNLDQLTLNPGHAPD